MASSRVICTVLILTSWTTLKFFVTGIGSSTMGSYFIVQLIAVEGDDVTSARAFTVASGDVLVTMSAKTSTDRSLLSLTVRQYEPVVFQMDPFYKCQLVGVCSVTVFNGSGLFALDVMTLLSPKNGDAMQVIPVNGYGTKYFVISLGDTSFLLILSPWDDNKINIQLKTLGRSITVEKKKYKHGDMLTIVLGKEQSYNLVLCSNTVDFSGTVASGNQTFGVITGSCNGIINPYKNCKSGVFIPNYLSDMALPLESYGKHFVILERGFRTHNNRYAVLINSQEDTTVKIKTMDKYKVVLREVGTYYALQTFPNDHYYIMTDYPCACYLLLPSSCEESEFGDASITVVPPVELYFSVYMWSFQTAEYTSEMQTYVLLIVHIWYLNKIVINETLIYNKYSIDWEKILGTSEWMVGAMQVQGGSHFFTLTSSIYKFGCFILVSSEGFGFVATPGFILSSINHDYQRCIHSVKGDRQDYTDNDCDGRIDEEIKNEIDDDGDTKIDEDVGMQDFAIGTWTRWESWTCKGLCGNTTYTQYRYCKSPTGPKVDLMCPGAGEKAKPGVCQTKRQCQLNGCPKGTFGNQCSGDCSNCQTECNPINGICQSCKPGWSQPAFACSRECPRFTFGFNCTGLCEKKCGEDCVERVLGSCPESKALMSVVIPFILAPLMGCGLLIIVCQLIKHRKNKFLILKDCTTCNEPTAPASLPSVSVETN